LPESNEQAKILPRVDAVLLHVLFNFATLFSTNLDNPKIPLQLRGGTSLEPPVSSNCILRPFFRVKDSEIDLTTKVILVLIEMKVKKQKLK